ncbi:unnamed protein product [Cunninghamella blakesleeana]
MGAQVVDYRVSTVAVLCQDCGEDVLYPTRHKCQPNNNRPPVPAIPTRYTDSSNSFQVSRKPVSSPDSSYSVPSSGTSSFSNNSSPSISDNSGSPTGGKWAQFGNRNKSPEQQNNDSSYFDKFAEHLPNQEPQPQGRKLWGKVRQNEKWKQLTEKNDGNQKTGKLWGKLMQATQNISERIPSRDDKGAESDESDWEGETHVSRILREYHEKKNNTLPNWLFDDRTPRSKRYQQSFEQHQPNNNTMHHQPSSSSDHLSRTGTSRRRLWDTSNEMSSRERERNELRQQAQYDKSNHQPEQRHHQQTIREDRYRQSDNLRGSYSNSSMNDDYNRMHNEQKPISYRSSGRISQGDPSATSDRRYRARDVSPMYGGYENETDDYFSSNQPSSNDRLRGSRNPPPSSRPNRYLNTNHGNYI